MLERPLVPDACRCARTEGPCCEKSEAWRRDFIEQRPHRAIGNKVLIALTKSAGVTSPSPCAKPKTLPSGGPSLGSGSVAIRMPRKLPAFYQLPATGIIIIVAMLIDKGTSGKQG